MTKKKAKKAPPSNETPRLVALKVRNWMRIEAFDAEFKDGALILFTGKNRIGKTSALTAIDVCLRGPRSKAMPAEPVHDGAAEKDMLIELDLGTLIAKRTMVRGRMALDVRPKKKGAVALASGQAFLDELIGQFMDPREFDAMDKAKRLTVLRDLMALDFTGHDASRAEHYAARTDVGKDIKRLTGAIEELPEACGDEETLSPSEILEEIRRREEINDDHNSKRDLLSGMRARGDELAGVDGEPGEIDGLKSKVAEMGALLTGAKRMVTEAEAELANLRSKGKPLAAEIELLEDLDVEDLKTQLADAEGAVQRAADAKRRAVLMAELAGYEKEREALTAKIDQIDEVKADAIAKAKYPIKGLEARDDGVYLGGRPWEQASSAERQSASTAIGFALHPRLKAVIIRDGSLFDSESRAQLYRDTVAAGGQTIMEVVSDDPEIRVLIEDGEVEEDSE